MCNLHQQIVEWADHTVKVYKNIALKSSDKDYAKYTAFYTQSDLSLIMEHPSLVILAINPNSICSYSDQVKNPYWNLKEEEDMTTDCFLKGNPSFKDRDKWPLWRRLSQIFQYGAIEEILQCDGDFVYTNIVNFNSRHPNEIPSDIFQQCAQYTFELLRLLQPKFIICLGNAPFDILAKNCNQPIDTVINGEVSRIVWGTCSVIKIPHTSKFYTHEEMVLVGKVIAEIVKCPSSTSCVIRDNLNQEIQTFELRKSEGSKNRKKQLAVHIDLSRLPYKVVDFKNQRFLFAGYLELTICEKQNFIGIRHLVRHGNYLIHPEPNEEVLRSLLGSYGFKTDKESNIAWLGRKNLVDYGSSVEEVNANIQSELKEIEYSIRLLENQNL